MKKLVNAAFWAILLLAAPPIQAFDPNSMARIIASQTGKPFVLIV